MYEFRWKNDEEIGFHEVELLDEENNVIYGSNVSVWDYTSPFQERSHRSRDINDPETFLWTHCAFGTSSSRLYHKSDSRTLESVKAEVEQFIKELYVGIYRQAVKNEVKYRSLYEWAEGIQK